MNAQEADIRVTLSDMQNKLSEDKVYTRIERPKGILRWEIAVLAKASGEKAHLVEYYYKVEFDRNLSLGLPSSDKQSKFQEEFKKMHEQLKK